MLETIVGALVDAHQQVRRHHRSQRFFQEEDRDLGPCQGLERQVSRSIIRVYRNALLLTLCACVETSQGHQRRCPSPNRGGISGSPLMIGTRAGRSSSGQNDGIDRNDHVYGEWHIESFDHILIKLLLIHPFRGLNIVFWFVTIHEPVAKVICGDHDHARSWCLRIAPEVCVPALKSTIQIYTSGLFVHRNWCASPLVCV